MINNKKKECTKKTKNILVNDPSLIIYLKYSAKIIGKTTKSPNFVAGVTFSNLWIKSLDSTCFFLLTDELLMCVKVWISGNRMIRSYAYPEVISHFWLTNTRVWFNKHTPRLKILLALFGFSYKLLLVYVSCTCLIAPCHRRVIAEM